MTTTTLNFIAHLRAEPGGEPALREALANYVAPTNHLP